MTANQISGACNQSAQYLQQRLPGRPHIGLILGSGLGLLADAIENPTIIEYRDVPGFLRTTVNDHAGRFIYGTLAGRNVLCMSGRFHYYEGYSFEQLTIPIRVFRLLGVRSTILTNAAGGVNSEYQVGDIMAIEDHINLAGVSPMRGENDIAFGERFFDTSTMYTPELLSVTRLCAQKLGIESRVRQGVYFYATGPHFETPAEIRAMRLLGADAVGMSTVPEALTAAHCGMPLLGLSLITNMAAGMQGRPLQTGEVSLAAKEAAGRFGALITSIIKEV